MDRDAFARMKARQDIVTAFINKLDKADMDDIDLIPALMDYVNTGDRTMFDKYNNFRKVTDAENRAKDMELRIADAKERYEKLKAEYARVDKQAEEYRSQVNKIISEYQDWVHNLRKTVADEHPQKAYPNMKALQEFAQKCIDESPNGYQRKLWLKDGNKMKTVTAILFDGNKAILETEVPTTLLVPGYQ